MLQNFLDFLSVLAVAIQQGSDPCCRNYITELSEVSVLENDIIKKITELLDNGDSVFEKVSSAINVMCIAKPVFTIDHDVYVSDAFDILIPAALNHSYVVIVNDNTAMGYIRLLNGDKSWIEADLVDAYARNNYNDDIIPDSFDMLMKLDDPEIVECSYPITSNMIFLETSSLLELFDYFTNNNVAFILSKNKQITHIVEASNMDSMPVKLTIFALLLELEEKMTLLLEQQPNLDLYINMLPAKSIERIKRFARSTHKRDVFTAKEMLSLTTLSEKHSMLKEHVMINDLGKKISTNIGPQIIECQNLRNMIAHGNPQALSKYTPTEMYETINSILFLVKIVYDFIDFNN